MLVREECLRNPAGKEAGAECGGLKCHGDSALLTGSTESFFLVFSFERIAMRVEIRTVISNIILATELYFKR